MKTDFLPSLIRLRLFLITVVGLGARVLAQNGKNLANLDVTGGTAYPSGLKIDSNFVPSLATGRPRGHYSLLGEDLASFCVQFGVPVSAGYSKWRKNPRFDLKTTKSAGSLENVTLLTQGDRTHLALVQSDLWWYLHLSHSNEAFKGEEKEQAQQTTAALKLLVPLHTESIHIVVRNEDVNSGDLVDLLSLYSKNKTVYIGSRGSGTEVTTKLLAHVISDSSPEGEWWSATNESDYLALEGLLRRELDGVFLVGGIPHPALDRLAISWKRNREKLGYSEEVEQAPLTLLPFGRAEAAFDTLTEFRGYVESHIRPVDYPDLSLQDKVSTRAVTCCLLSYDSVSVTGRDRQTILWVRHVVKRLLSNLDSTSKTGLIEGAGVPQAGRIWTEIKPPNDWGIYGWERHGDSVIRKMTEIWEAQNDPLPLSRALLGK